MGCTSSVSPVASRDGAFEAAYELKHIIGKGSFANVWAAHGRTLDAETQEAQICAVKIVYIETSRTSLGESVVSNVRRDAENEATVWQRIGRNEHCVELLAFFVEVNVIKLVMERCVCSLIDLFESAKWDWNDALSSGGGDAEVELARYFREMLVGLAHVHARGVVHRDVKTDNFLLGSMSGDTVKLCDFGFATALPKSGVCLMDVKGTDMYISPEMYEQKGYGTQTDLWSLGVTAYTLLFAGVFPYQAKASLQKQPPPSFKLLSEAKQRGCQKPPAVATSLCKQLLQPAPEKRYTAAAGLKLDYLQLSQRRSKLPSDFSSMSELSEATISTRRISRSKTESRSPSKRSRRRTRSRQDTLDGCTEHSDQEIESSSNNVSRRRTRSGQESLDSYMGHEDATDSVELSL